MDLIFVIQVFACLVTILVGGIQIYNYIITNLKNQIKTELRAELREELENSFKNSNERSQLNQIIITRYGLILLEREYPLSIKKNSQFS
jgi:hypothetical protein